MNQKRQPAGVPTGGQFAAAARAESGVQLHPPADPDTEVTIPNPDDPHDMPIYEGPASGAASMLVPGQYTAYDLDDTGPAYLVIVPDQEAASQTDG